MSAGDAPTLSLELRRRQHVDNISWFTLIALPLSVVVFAADVATDWYLTGAYLHYSHLQSENILDRIILEYLNSSQAKYSLPKYKKFCKDVFTEEIFSEMVVNTGCEFIFFIDEVRFDETLKNTNETYLYEFIHKTMMTDGDDLICLSSDKMLPRLYNCKMPFVGVKPIQTGGLFFFYEEEIFITYVCDTVLNRPTKYKELLHGPGKTKCPKCLSVGRHYLQIDCKKYKSKSEEELFEIYKTKHQMLCENLFWPRKIFDRVVYEHIEILKNNKKMERKEILGKILNNKKLLDKDIYRYLNNTLCRTTSLQIIEWYLKKEYDSVKIAYERKYWYSKFGVAVGLTVLLATIANLRLPLWYV